MFKLESYITPLLMSYIDKYVKLKHEDFQLSLWGGDAVFNKLDLRLDAIEHMLNLPISFKSGQIYELRVHVPWTKLGSEPVVITINTIECIVKLRDYESSSASTGTSASQTSVTPQRIKIKKQDQEELPPGYLQSLITKVINNLNIVVNNLILKFVEDDIVLSVNAKSAECFSVNETWMRAFTELSLPELVLRKVVNFHDLTVCLDKRNSDGKIEVYQDPLLYRCSLTCRLHMLYDNLYSSLPSVTKFNLLCDKLDISLTDTQLPMFCHLMEMCVAIYYGCLGPTPGNEAKESSVDPHSDQPHQDFIALQQQHEAEGQGWVSWAWSYVPQILPTDAEEWEKQQSKKADNAILCVGIYVTKGSISFKLTETHQETAYGVPKVSFHPCLVWEAEGVCTEVLVQGITYVNAQLGVTNSRIICKGDSISGVKDLENTDRDPCALRIGPPLSSKQNMAYDTNSLFDPGGMENQSERPSYVTQQEGHMELFTESYGQDRFGALWMDYLYTMERDQSRERRGSQASHSEESCKENACLRFLIGPFNMVVSSSAMQRVMKMVTCALDHEYESYLQFNKDPADDKCQPPTEEEVQAMEHFVPTRTYSVTFLKPCIWVKAADLPIADLKKKKVSSQRRSKKGKKSAAAASSTAVGKLPNYLPVVVVKAERVEYQLTRAMYPGHHVRRVSKMVAPSSDLLHLCHSHMNVKLFGFCMGLSKTKGIGDTGPVQTIIEPCSGVFYMKTLLFPECWNNPLQSQIERFYELPQFGVTLNKAQLMLITYLVTSWFEKNPNAANLANTTLMGDVFNSEKKLPVSEVCLAGLEVRECLTQGVYAVTATLTSLQAVMFHKANNADSITPLLFGPLDSSKVPMQTFFTTPGHTGVLPGQPDCVVMTIQLPRDPSMPAAPGVCLIQTEGIVGCLDPILHDWFSYVPKVKRSSMAGREDVGAHPVGGLASGRTDGSTTETGTDGQGTKSFLVSSSRPGLTSTDAETTKQEEATPGEKAEEQLGGLLARYWPLLKLMYMQIHVNSISFFLPLTPLHLQDPTMNILQNLQQVQVANALPATLVISCPAFKVVNGVQGQKPFPTLQEIPISALDQSVAGDKTPWKMQLSDCSIYTIQSPQKFHFILKPASMSATLAITPKYHPPTSDNVTSLSLGVHADMDLLAIGISQPQVQLVYDLAMAGITTGYKVLESIEIQKSLLNADVPATSQNSDVLRSLPTQLSPSTPMNNAQAGLASSSSQWEPGETLPQTITGTSEASVSRCTTPNKEEESGGSVKLSLWMQWTLPKLLLRLYSVGESGLETCLQGALEDVMTSVDLQEVYAKVKCKVEHVDVKHMVKNGLNNTWASGDFEGVLLTSLQKLNKELTLAANRPWVSQSQPSINLFTEEDMKPRDSSHGFLNLTFTRAQRKNVKKKLKRMFSDQKDAEDRRVSEDVGPVDPGYLNEVCLNIQPCDIVVNCPVIANALQLFNIGTTEKKMPKRGDGGIAKNLKTKTESMSLPWLTSDILPLIYIDCSTVRIFVPKCDVSDAEMSPDLSSKQKASANPYNHDLLMLQILSITMTPQVDNPLPRVIVNKEIYRMVLKSSVHGQLGTDLEDRQYQLDMRGLSLSTGCWRHLVIDQRRGSNLVSQETPVQHPALEWNNLVKTENEREDVKMLPLASSLDLRIVAAPAIVYKPTMATVLHSVTEASVVCGYSLEVNATSDMDFFMSVAQMKMLLDMVNTNVCQLQKISQCPSPIDVKIGGRETPINPLELNRESIMLQSESSAKSESRLESESKSTCPNMWDQITPFSVLLTAGRISCMLYTHKLSLEKGKKQADTPMFVIGSPSLKPKSKGNLELREESMSTFTLSSADSGVESGYSSAVTDSQQKQVSLLIVPFLFATFSQPHTFISVQDEQQRADLSCYDIVLKGTKPGYAVTDDSRLLPEASDFGYHWIETRLGEADKKTGILPSLYTLSARDFLKAPVEIKLRLERPLKFNLSADRLSQVVGFGLMLQKELQEEIDSVFQNFFSAPVSAESPTVEDPNPKPPYLSTFTHLSKISMTTTQIVVAMETSSSSHQVGLQFSIGGFNSQILFSDITENIKEIDFVVNLYDLILKTLYGNSWQSLIGPLPLSLTLNSQWLPHSGPSNLPRILCFVESGKVPICVGQENVLCFIHLQEQIRDCINVLAQLQPTPAPKEITPKSDHQKSGSHSRRGSTKLHKAEPAVQVTVDDLRSGMFSYNTNTDEEVVLPAVYEVTFNVDYSEGGGSMIWHYPEPRAIRSISSQPVPYNLPKQLDVRYIDETMMIPCILQHYNPLTKLFEDYRKFHISGSNQMTLTLPEVTGDLDLVDRNKVKVANIWRVLILHPKVEDSDYEFLLNLDPKQGSTLEPVIWPQTLAASLKVDSCFLPTLVPALQVAFSADLIAVRMAHQLQTLSREVPDKLKPYKLPLVAHSSQPYLEVNFEDPVAQMMYLGGPLPRADVQFAGSLDAAILEYRNLTMFNFIEHFGCHGNLHWQQHQQFSVTKAILSIDPVCLKVGASVIHSLSTAAQAWDGVTNESSTCQIVPHHFLICNDTHHALRIGQVDTDESIMVESRYVMPYSWRSHQQKQLLHLTLASHGGQWCKPINLDLEGNFIRVIEHKGQRSTLIIRIKQVTGVQKQVIISGQLVICSRIDQNLEVKVVTQKPGVTGNEVSYMLEGLTTGASCVVEHEAVQAVRVRLHGVKMPWSAELPVCGEKVKDSKLIKIPMSDRISYLHVWCHVFWETIEDATQTAVIFAPLFVTRSHLPSPLLMNIETPRLKNSMQIEVKGQGQEEYLPSISGDMTHSITFQLSTAMKLSSPAISLSSGMSEQISTTSIQKVDVDHLAHHWKTPSGHVWPYNQLNKIKLDDIKSPIVAASKAQDIIIPQETSRADIQCKETEQPNIDLQICLQQRWPGFNTLLIDIAPYWFLVNDSLFDFIVLESNDHQWYLPCGKTFSPPQFEGSFRIGLAVEDMLHLSDAITLSNEERTYKFMADIEMTLYRQCHLKVTIPIKQESRVVKLCHLVLHSVIHENMQVITIRHRYNVVNRLKSAFQLQCYSLPLTQQKLSVEHKERLAVDIPERQKLPFVTLPFWNIPLSCNVSEVDSTRCVHYMYFKQASSFHPTLSDQSQSSDADHMTWSQPMRVRISESGTRSNVSLQFVDKSGRHMCKSYVVICQEKLGMVFLTVEEELHPTIELHNHCACTLHYGQTLMGVHVEDVTVQEEAELTTDLPTLPPGGVAHYAFPACNGHFPEVSASSNIPKLHLAGVLDSGGKEKDEKEQLAWSTGIDLSYEHDVFVTIPNICDVKVHVEKVGHTTHVFVDPVGRAEVSAREIRSRIKGKDQVTFVEEKKAASPPRDLYLPNVSKSIVSSKAMMLEGRVICKKISFVFLDLNTKTLKIQEIARMSLDDFVISVVPNIEDSLDQMKNYEPHVKYATLIAVGDFQLDNQLHSGGGFDFHVLFIREDYDVKRVKLNHAFFDNSELRSVAKQQSLLVIDLELCQDLVKSQLVMETATISAKPTVLFLEDTFLYEFLKRLDKCIPVSLSSINTADTISIPLPHEVIQTAFAMCQPIRLQKLTVQPISIKLSLHASLKVFVALDNAPLSFGVFQRDNLFTVPSWMLHALLMHYVAAALFRAGWVVGSLEILGSPSGLVRHLTNGIMDLFRMPYQGIMRGPGAFLGGLVGGIGSLVRNVSTGTLTSVTNFASSVSRNMDRLSLDSQHFERQEEGRRRRPSRVSDGLRQGIAGFALSLLGAIAGLADQPLQNLYDDKRRGPGQAATGLVSGFGKGLVGVVTKPLGGAAELVSQTGYGILHGVGLTHLPQGRYNPTDLEASELPNSLQKYMQKILHTYPDISLLDAVNISKQESQKSDAISRLTSTLLLTPEILFLYSNSEDAQQQAYAMSQITCEADDADPSVLYISVRDPFTSQKDDSDEDINSKDRVAAFVNSAGTYSGFHGNKKHHYSNKDQSKRTIEFRVDPKHRDSFIATFNIAKYRTLGIGFPV